MNDIHSSTWFAKFPEDLAWDVLTLVCIVATGLAMSVAGVAAVSVAFMELIAEWERWLWGAAITLAIIAMPCLLRVLLNDRFERILPRHSA